MPCETLKLRRPTDGPTVALMKDDELVDVGPSADSLLAAFAAVNTSWAFDDVEAAPDTDADCKKREDNQHKTQDAKGAEGGCSSAPAIEEFNPAHRWPERLEAFGLQLEGGDERTGRHLTAIKTFEAGSDLLRETPAIWVSFDEPWSALETRMAEHFHLKKMAPPYRLLARAIEHDHRKREAAERGWREELLLDGASLVMSMAANLEVANDGWPSKFCAFLAAEGDVAGEVVTRMLAIIKTNAFGIYSVGTDGLSNRGLGLYPMAGRANHVCDPSAVWAFEGETLVVRALRTVRAGDAVTISYLLPREPLVARRQKLSESYRFRCVCARCLAEAPQAEVLTVRSAAVSFHRPRCTLSSRTVHSPHASCAQAAAGELRQLRSGLDELHVSGRLSEEHTNAIERCAALFDQLTPSGHAHPESAAVLLKLASWWIRVWEGAPGGAKTSGAKSKGAKSKGAKVRAYREHAAAHLRRARGMVIVCLGAEHSLRGAIDEMMGTIDEGPDSVEKPNRANETQPHAAARVGGVCVVSDVTDAGGGADEGVFVHELSDAHAANATSEAAKEAAATAAEGEAQWLHSFWFGGQMKKHSVRMSIEGRSGVRVAGPLEAGESAEQFEARWLQQIRVAGKKVDVEDLGMMDAARLWDAIPEDDGAGRGRRDLERIEKDLSVKVVFCLSNGHVLLVGAKAKLQKKTFVLRNLLSHYHWRLSGRDVAFEQMAAK